MALPSISLGKFFYSSLISLLCIFQLFFYFIIVTQVFFSIIAFITFQSITNVNCQEQGTVCSALIISNFDEVDGELNGRNCEYILKDVKITNVKFTNVSAVSLKILSLHIFFYSNFIDFSSVERDNSIVKSNSRLPVYSRCLLYWRPNKCIEHYGDI